MIPPPPEKNAGDATEHPPCVTKIIKHLNYGLNMDIVCISVFGQEVGLVIME